MPIPGENEDITRHIEPMDISVKGTNLDVGDALSSHVGAQLDGAQDRVANSSGPIRASRSTITQRTRPSTTCCPSGNIGWIDPANTLPSLKTIA
jgi:hypothetical protein